MVLFPASFSVSRYPARVLRLPCFGSMVASVSDIVPTIKLGARDYLLKPVHREHLLELAEKLKVSHRSLQDYRNNGILPYTQVGGKNLYRASDIERILTGGYQEAYRLKRRT